FNYATTHDEDISLGWGVEIANIDTEASAGSLIRGTDTFLLSRAEIPGGTLVYLNGSVGAAVLNGYPLVNDGYNWSFNTQQSLEALGSLSTFGKYRLSAAGYFKVDERGDALAARVRYETTTGDVPNYEAPVIGPFIRGYTGVDHYAASGLTINTEARFMIDPEIGQFVLFFDAGKGWDDPTLKFSDLEYGYGAGVRLRTGHWIPIDILIYADYAIGVDDNEFVVGIGQWF
ncbi:MAG: BamA/TamA family outer membrane protein, partial [bacterium]